MLINPNFKPPLDYRPIQTKKNRKIYIPMKEYPDYNFIGLIIGPRGLTQKQMEKESGCKIAIRGRGSVKEGKGKPTAADDEELHVLITGDTEENVSIAAKRVNELLVPVEEGKNEHKLSQLRKLAEINGTLRENIWANVPGRTWTSPNVYCKHCGEISHPSSDCPFKGKSTVNKEKLDEEYKNFMSSIGSGDSLSSSSSTQSTAEKSYEEFMAAISDTSSSSKPPPPPPQSQQQQYHHQQSPNTNNNNNNDNDNDNDMTIDGDRGVESSNHPNHVVPWANQYGFPPHPPPPPMMNPMMGMPYGLQNPPPPHHHPHHPPPPPYGYGYPNQPNVNPWQQPQYQQGSPPPPPPPPSQWQ